MIERLYLPFDENEVQYRITQVFGVAPRAYPASGGHNGIDFGLPKNTPIYSALYGRVIRADFNPDGYGRSVWIMHTIDDQRYVTIYAHLSKIEVVENQIVTAKQLVGLSGGDPSDPYAGRTTGLHLHFELRFFDAEPSDKAGEKKYNARDPYPYLVGWEKEHLCPIGQGVVNVARTVYTRKLINGEYRLNQADVLWKDERVWIYKEQDGYYRVSDTFNRWVTAKYVTVTNWETDADFKKLHNCN